MREVTTNTRVGELKAILDSDEYPITYREFDTLHEAFAAIGGTSEGEVEIEAPEGAQQAVLGVINAAQKQGALQGGKEMVREAVQDPPEGVDPVEAAEAAVAKHQERAAKYVIGAPRGGRGGVTKTKARELGARLREKMGDEALLAFAREQGIDPAELGITLGSNEE